MRKQTRHALTPFILFLGAFVQAAPLDVFSAADWRSAATAHIAPSAAAGRALSLETRARGGRELLEELHELTARGFHQRSYQDASLYMFSVADNVASGGRRGVFDSYSGVFVAGSSADGSDYPEAGDENEDGFSDRNGMNVEHVWPQSFFGSRHPMKSDLHNLLPTFIHPNSVRGHLPFGTVLGRGDYSNNGGGKRGQGLFEPPDAVKGAVARSLLYFYTRYNDQNITNGNYDNDAFWNNNIELLLRWNRLFPPTANERRRNDLVEKFQGNRNPFIDAPSLADSVGRQGFWRGSKTQRLLQRIQSGKRVSAH